MAHQPTVSAIDVHQAAPGQQAPPRDGGLPVPSQGCSSAVALPVFAMIPVSAALTPAPPLERLATLVALHEPPTLFRPPRA